MAEETLATLRLGGVCVAGYSSGSDLPPDLAPRPHLHPVRTLAGRPVTDAQPADHRWHLGISIAVPDVGGWNFWGGPSYLRDDGYTWRADHGRIEHAGFSTLQPEGFDEQLRWLAPGGEPVLAELRRVRARPVEHGWALEITSTLSNVSGRELTLGSPASNGRTGAGYGGLFWRLPPAGEPSVRAGGLVGEEPVHGSVGSCLVWTDRVAWYTVALTGTDAATRSDPWFVRVGEYPGIGSQLAAREPLPLPVEGSVRRGFCALVADGVLQDSAVEQWVAEIS